MQRKSAASGTRRLAKWRPQPTTQRMSDGSKDARVGQLAEGNRKLREEVSWLREQNEALLGQLRLKSVSS